MNSQFPAFGSRSLTSSARAGKPSLDFDIGSLLGDDKLSRTSTLPARSRQTEKLAKRSDPKQATHQTRPRPGSRRKDGDVLIGLAAEAGGGSDNKEEAEPVTQEDAMKIGSNLADMDNLDDNLFSSSLTRSGHKTGRSKRRQTGRNSQTAPTPAKVAESKLPVEVERTEKTKLQTKKSTASLFDDIDDPFAGILSSDEEDKAEGTVARGGEKKEGKAVVGVEERENAEVHDATSQSKSSSLLSQMSPRLRRAALGDQDATTLASANNMRDPSDTTPSDAVTPKTGTVLTPSHREHLQPLSISSTVKAKAATDNWSDDDDDLLGDLGFDSSPPTQNKASVTAKGSQKLGDVFSKSSRFDELLGKSDSTAVSPPQIAEPERDSRPQTRGKKQLELSKEMPSPDQDDDFQFGSYAPSIGTSNWSGRQSSGSRQRPSTAPSAGAKSKSVRFADELGLELDAETNRDTSTGERPSSSPAQVTGRSRRRALDMVDRDDGSQKTTRPKKQASVVDRLALEDGDAGQQPEPLSLADLSSVGDVAAGPDVLTVAEKDGEEDREQRAELERVDDGLDTAVGDELFGSDLGLGLMSRQRPSTGQRRAQEEKLLFPWESSTPRSRGRRQPGTAMSMPDQTDSTLSTNLTATVQRSQSAPEQDIQQVIEQETRPATAVSDVSTASNFAIPTQSERGFSVPTFPSTASHQLSHFIAQPTHQTAQQATDPLASTYQSTTPLQQQQTVPVVQTTAPAALQQPPVVPALTGILPSQLSGLDSSVHGVSLALSHTEASAVAIANAAAEGRQAVLREEIEKLRNENRMLKIQIGELEAQCSAHEKQKQTWLEERDAFGQQLETREEQNLQDIKERKQRETELETKIQIGEVEKKQLQDALAAAGDRHRQELENMEAVNSRRIQGMEESFQRQEARLREEIEKQAAEHNRQIIELEKAKSSVVTVYERKLADADREHLEATERLKETHRSLIDELKLEHDRDKNRQQKLHQQELSAVAQAHSHTRSLQELISQVHQSTQHVSELQQRVDMTHTVGHQQREQALRVREEQLQGLEERLLRQQLESEQERNRLHSLVAKMEGHIREQSRQIEQDRWKIQQDESRLQTLQRALEHDRVTTAESVAREREELQRAREQMLKEQQVVLSQCYAERRGLAEERSQLSVTQRRCYQREQDTAVKSVQFEAELKSELESVQQQAEDLARSRHKIRDELERLSEERNHFELEKRHLHEEKDKLQQTKLKLQENAREVEQLHSGAAEAREVGKQSLHEAELLRADIQHQASDLETKRQQLEEHSRKIAQERLELARERMAVEKARNSWLQERSVYLGQRDQTSFVAAPLSSQPRYTSTPAVEVTQTNQHPGVRKTERMQGQDLTSRHATTQAIAQLEYKRALRLWTNANEKQVEELHEENSFLDALQTSRTSTKTALIS